MAPHSASHNYYPGVVESVDFAGCDSQDAAVGIAACCVPYTAGAI